jgi:pimeloyl-ACP methyl ester carboxylesterase
MNHVREGSGPPLLLVHGLGGHWRSWTPVLPLLSRERELIMVDLPGHGDSPSEANSGTFAGLVDSVSAFLDEQDMVGVDAVGSSMGARLVLELARRGRVGAVVSLDPGGFWRGWERNFFKASIGTSVRLLRALRPALPYLSHSVLARSTLLAQLSRRPWKLNPELVRSELQSYAACTTFDALVSDLGNGPEQVGPKASTTPRVVIGWGRQDRLCLPRQAARALDAFPSARLHWFDRCGHFPMWDRPHETASLILSGTAIHARSRVSIR